MKGAPTELWTCDRCGVTKSASMNVAPDGWRGIAVIDPPLAVVLKDVGQLPDRDEKVATVKARYHFCADCVKQLIEMPPRAGR